MRVFTLELNNAVKVQKSKGYEKKTELKNIANINELKTIYSSIC